MIKKEDFIKKFPLKVKGCTVDLTVSMNCCIDDNRDFDCVYAQRYRTKEKCPHWQDLPNWEYVDDIWKWIENYQKSGDQ